MKLLVENVSYSANGKFIIDDISLQAADKQFIGVIGPNGSGKSTLLKNASRILTPDSGKVWLNDKGLHEMPAKQAAKQLAVVSQEAAVPFDFTVEEIVAMGRHPYKKFFQHETEEDRQIIHESLAYVDMVEYGQSSFQQLSGGEKQRVFIARALAQKAGMVILDEPTNHLDIRHQLQLLDLVKKLPITVLAALHDLNLAAFYCDYIYVMNGGRMICSGTPSAVLSKDMLKEVFGVDGEIQIHPRTNKPHITFLAHV
ncbi:ABC transporter ATP-binding protein [Pseudobacillus sp. 179-B 2D1 NHS]|uniref:ABC transporter ATP-binding protein n=1 Tax=Pseudobacillus sp. 179-B 2D1 NHS TaxID=3374292 RepID=UPI003879E360